MGFLNVKKNTLNHQFPLNRGSEIKKMKKPPLTVLYATHFFKVNCSEKKRNKCFMDNFRPSSKISI